MNKQNIIVLFGGIFFGFGLAYSGMTKQEIVLSFLQLKDLGLIFVMGGAALVAFFAINVVPRFLKAAVRSEANSNLRKAAMSQNVIIGAVIFGIGWGISGQCPRLRGRQFRNRKPTSLDRNSCDVHRRIHPRIIGFSE